MSKHLTPEQYRNRNKKMPILNAKYEYMSPKEYAEFSGWHVITVYKMLETGRIEGAVKMGKRWFIPVQKDN